MRQGYNSKMTEKLIITRFAPSPTGRLHRGHAYSALKAYNFAKDRGGRFILRIEDIDTTRCKSEYTQGIYEDLKWLGLKWEEPVRIQSEHFADYQSALETLKAAGLVYPCFCTRSDIKAEIARSPKAPHGPEGALYPGTCKSLSQQKKDEQIASSMDHAWRLDVTKSIEHLKDRGAWPLYWTDMQGKQHEADPLSLGDVVLARKDTPTSYHLSVTVDDALQGISHIIRGEDLLHTTPIHVLLQALLDLPTPLYEHHKLLLDQDGKRFAKRDKSMTLENLRSEGVKACSLFTQ